MLNRRLLGFTCATLLDDGVQEMIEEFKKGTYGSYKAETYSNVRTTQKALTEFRDPRVASKLYRPLVEMPSALVRHDDAMDAMRLGEFRGQLDMLDYGCERAEECGVTADRVINTWPVDRLLEWAGKG